MKKIYIRNWIVIIELIDSQPLIWRRVIIPADVTFKRLHDTIQFYMDWWDYHFYEFEFPEEKLRVTNNEEYYEENKFGHPIVLEGEGACPPEDVGGLGGYEEFLEAWSNSENEEHERMRTWGISKIVYDISNL